MESRGSSGSTWNFARTSTDWRLRKLVAVDRNQLSRDLSRFYDFTGKTVVYVGGGNGQLLNTAGIAYLVAIEEDPRRADKLRASLSGGPGLVEIITARFEDVRAHGDVVYFEFCLHEMNDPRQALEHARELAPEIIVFDHSAGSEWSFYAAEDEKVRRGAKVVQHFGARRRKQFVGEQRFRNYAELAAKLLSQGSVSAERARRFAGITNIVIPMKYELALL